MAIDKSIVPNNELPSINTAIAGAGKTLGRPASLADKTMGQSVGRARLWVSLCTKLIKFSIYLAGYRLQVTGIIIISYCVSIDSIDIHLSFLFAHIYVC